MTTTLHFNLLPSTEPSLPAVPIGLYIKHPNKKARYYSFGHIDKNNSSALAVSKLLTKAFLAGEVVCNNSKQLLRIIKSYFCLPLPSYEVVHDVSILSFLNDPHREDTTLPDTAEGIEALFHSLYLKVGVADMLIPYNRERRLIPVLIDMEETGLRINLNTLGLDIAKYDKCILAVNTYLNNALGTVDINVNAFPAVVSRLIATNNATSDLKAMCKKGIFIGSKHHMMEGITNPVLKAVLQYRYSLDTCLNTFMKPWYKMAADTNGVIYTTWNSVRTTFNDKEVGAKTGRICSTPSFQNIPKSFDNVFSKVECPWSNLPALPDVRKYVIPFEGETFIDRDYSQQELRILAHYERGAMLQQYQSNPWTDLHAVAQERLKQAGKDYERKQVKNTNLGLIYGMGVGTLAEKNDMTKEEADALRKDILCLYPNLSLMQDQMRQVGINDLSIRTKGGRRYFCEPPEIIDGITRTFDYKLLNVLIQGSAADCTKEALIRYYANKHDSAKIVLNVHDQITVSVPAELVESEMKVLRQAMEDAKFRVSMLTEGSISDSSWGSLVDYDKRGELI